MIKILTTSTVWFENSTFCYAFKMIIYIYSWWKGERRNRRIQGVCQSVCLSFAKMSFFLFFLISSHLKYLQILKHLSLILASMPYHFFNQSINHHWFMYRIQSYRWGRKWGASLHQSLIRQPTNLFIHFQLIIIIISHLSACIYFWMWVRVYLSMLHMCVCVIYTQLHLIIFSFLSLSLSSSS